MGMEDKEFVITFSQTQLFFLGPNELWITQTSSSCPTEMTIEIFSLRPSFRINVFLITIVHNEHDLLAIWYKPS